MVFEIRSPIRLLRKINDYLHGQTLTDPPRIVFAVAVDYWFSFHSVFSIAFLMAF
jgi:hypothetical protein